MKKKLEQKENKKNNRVFVECASTEPKNGLNYLRWQKEPNGEPQVKEGKLIINELSLSYLLGSPKKQTWQKNTDGPGRT